MADDNIPCCGGPGTGLNHSPYGTVEKCGGGSIEGPFQLLPDIGQGSDYPKGQPITIYPDGSDAPLTAPFGIKVEFKEPCGCCQYRQCVKGYVALRGPGGVWQNIHSANHYPRDTYTEDLAWDGSPYGHPGPGTQDDHNAYFPPCAYEMSDTLGFAKPNPDTHYMFKLEFKAVILDACRGIVLGETTFTVQTAGAMDYPGPAYEPVPPTPPNNPPDPRYPGLAMASDSAAPSYEPKLTATLQAGPERLTAAVEAHSRGLRLQICRGRALSDPPTPVADLQVTLLLKDGSTVQPPLLDPGLDELVGFCSHGRVIEGATYDLAEFDLDDLDAIQAELRGEQSERAVLQAHRPVERLSR